MKTFFRYFFPNKEVLTNDALTSEEIKQRDTVLKLLNRIGTAKSIHVDSAHNVSICWGRVWLFLHQDHATVDVSDSSSSVAFSIPFKHCSEAKAAREAIYLNRMSDVCEQAIRATDRT